MTTHDKLHAARIKRAKRADKPSASAYSRANVHGAMAARDRPTSWGKLAAVVRAERKEKREKRDPVVSMMKRIFAAPIRRIARRTAP